jgi:hypothetical protein
MISMPRYLYHLQDIAEMKAKSRPLNEAEELRLRRMEAEAAEFKAADPGAAEHMAARAQELSAQK